MKQVLQHARTGEITVQEVPPPQLLPGCVLVRIAASVVSAGTERASAEFARKSLLQKAKSRPDLVREVIGKVQRDGILSAIQAVRSRLDQPQSPGYSSAGTVIAVGAGVNDLQPGDRVACAGAGFAVHAFPRVLRQGTQCLSTKQPLRRSVQSRSMASELPKQSLEMSWR